MNHSARITTVVLFLNLALSIAAFFRVPSFRALQELVIKKTQADDLNLNDKPNQIRDVRRLGLGMGFMAIGFNLPTPSCFSYKDLLFKSKRPPLSTVMYQGLKSCCGVRGIAYAFGSLYVYKGASGIAQRTGFSFA